MIVNKVDVVPSEAPLPTTSRGACALAFRQPSPQSRCAAAWILCWRWAKYHTGFSYSVTAEHLQNSQTAAKTSSSQSSARTLRHSGVPRRNYAGNEVCTITGTKRFRKFATTKRVTKALPCRKNLCPSVPAGSWWSAPICNASRTSDALAGKFQTKFHPRSVARWRHMGQVDDKESLAGSSSLR